MGIVLPFALCCLILWRAGVFGTFWFWTVDYAWQYASVVPLSYAPQLFWKGFLWVAKPGFLLWLMAGAGLILLMARRSAETVARVAPGILPRVRAGGLPGFFIFGNIIF